MFLGGSREIEPAAALKGSAAELSVVRGELGSTFPHEAALMLRPLPRGAGTIPKQVLEAEVAPQLTAQDAWRIPGTGEPGRRPSLGSHRIGHDHDLSTSQGPHLLILSLWGLGFHTDTENKPVVTGGKGASGAAREAP